MGLLRPAPSTSRRPNSAHQNSMVQSSDANHGQHASISIASKHATKISKIYPGADVQVLGIIASGRSLAPTDTRALRFCRMARDSLIIRSRRHFLYAFHMCKSTLEM